jgi:hypothetical protein
MLHPRDVPGIIEFIRFTYSNTRPGCGGDPEPLRDLVVRYVASTLPQLRADWGFNELLAEGGDSYMDLCEVFESA